MKKAVKHLVLVSFLAISGCSTISGWFEEDEPLPSELDRRTPVFNSSQSGTPFMDPMSAGAAPMGMGAMGMDSMGGMPPMGGGMPEAPEPPIFIGSNGAQQVPQPSTDVFATPLPAPSGSLPMSSPVDMSAAENAAVGLPVQRRAPAFNQALATPNASPFADSLPIPQPSIQPNATPIPALPTVNALPPIQSRDEFPVLAQIPPSPSAPPSAQMDSRVQQMKMDLDAASKRADAEADINAPISSPEFRRPAAQQSSAAVTSFTNLKPLPNEPIYKIADEPKVMGTQPRVLNTQQSYVPQKAITRLSDLRSISSGNRGGKVSYRRDITNLMSSEARHSTYYGEY